MDNQLQHIIQALSLRFKVESNEFRGQTILMVKAEDLLGLAQALHDEYSFKMLMDVTAVDYLSEEPRFNVVYQLYSMEKNQRISLRVAVNGQNPLVNSIVGIFSGANWFEREVMDMFGIQFEGHPDPRRIIMPADWQGHPLRKDYPLGYEEVQFSFNFEEINGRKPKGKELSPEA